MCTEDVCAQVHCKDAYDRLLVFPHALRLTLKTCQNERQHCAGADSVDRASPHEQCPQQQHCWGRCGASGTGPGCSSSCQQPAAGRRAGSSCFQRSSPASGRQPHALSWRSWKLRCSLVPFLVRVPQAGLCMEASMLPAAHSYTQRQSKLARGFACCFSCFLLCKLLQVMPFTKMWLRCNIAYPAQLSPLYLNAGPSMDAWGDGYSAYHLTAVWCMQRTTVMRASRRGRKQPGSGLTSGELHRSEGLRKSAMSCSDHTGSLKCSCLTVRGYCLLHLKDGDDSPTSDGRPETVTTYACPIHWEVHHTSDVHKGTRGPQS